MASTSSPCPQDAFLLSTETFTLQTLPTLTIQLQLDQFVFNIYLIH